MAAAMNLPLSKRVHPIGDYMTSQRSVDAGLRGLVILFIWSSCHLPEPALTEKIKSATIPHLGASFPEIRL
jgi:hypothetical protein